MTAAEGALPAPMAQNDAADIIQDDRIIADAAQLEKFAEDKTRPDNALTPEIRGVIAEAALTNTVRYEWRLLSPVLHCLLDAALDDFSKDTTGEVGPPRPMPDGQSLDAARTSLHTLLDAFTEPPFTLQRICELLLEPRKQYRRVDKFVLAIERLLLVTSTLKLTSNPPPLPKIASLGPVNENPPSPYDNEPIAQPLAHPTQPQGLQNGSMSGGEYVFTGASSSSADHPGLMGIAGEDRDIVERAPPPSLAPLAPGDVIQAEAFVNAALASPNTSPEKEAGSGGSAGAEQVAQVVAASPPQEQQQEVVLGSPAALASPPGQQQPQPEAAAPVEPAREAPVQEQLAPPPSTEEPSNSSVHQQQEAEAPVEGIPAAIQQTPLESANGNGNGVLLMSPGSDNNNININSDNVADGVVVGVPMDVDSVPLQEEESEEAPSSGTQ